VADCTISQLGDRIGQELGVSDWVTIDQSRIDAFAACTGDHQWIHVDVERAKRESPYRGPVAHGYLMLAMVAPLSLQIGLLPNDAAAGLNYGVDKARFLAPVPAGARVRLRVVLTGEEAPTENTIKAHVGEFADKGVISKYGVPQTILFVDQLERTSVGKIDKKLLRARYTQDE